jgi:asparagine synthase (glutamine-hydrolysing)
MGMKPLYLWRDDHGGVDFASEINAFLGGRGFLPRICKPALAQYLEFNFIHDLELTSLEGVRKIPAGHSLLVQRQLDGAVKVIGPTRYFEPPGVEPINGDPREPEERANRLYGVLQEVVQQHLVADVPVGLLLSGGLDSSVLAAIAARHGPLRTLSMGFADSRVDERPFAKQVSEHVGSHHEEVLLHPQEVASELERDVWFVDDLFGDWGVLTTLLLYRKCRAAGVKVVLVGEGADELFGGYPSFSRAAAPEADGYGASRRALRLYRWYSGRRWGPAYWQFRGLVRDLLTETGQDAFAAVRLFETRHQLPHCYNMKVDKASMAASVEARVPFLDVRVATEGFRCPRSLLLQGEQNKLLLRNVALQQELLPPAIVHRQKFGASMAASWMDEVPHFREFAKDVVLDPSGLTAEMGLLPAMRSYFEKSQQGYAFPRGISIFAMVAWRLLLLNLWARHYLRPGVAAQFAA